MTKTIKVGYLHRIKFDCVHCGHEHDLEVHECMGITVGTVIQPYAGGGNWGRCVKCKRAGLRAKTALEIEKKGPVGWNTKSANKGGS